MSTVVPYTALREFMDANWSGAPLSWENEPFEIPDPPHFVVVEVFGSSYEQRTIGSGDPAAERWEEEGAALFHVAVPRGTGSLQARQTAEALVSLLRGRQLSGDVRFVSASVGNGRPADEDGQLFMITARLDWARG
jgi:hypothetical protein